MEKIVNIPKTQVILAFVATCIETDSLYSETGVDTYELGMVDEEIYALCNTRDLEVVTFRV